jgi:hypothetical protein
MPKLRMSVTRIRGAAIRSQVCFIWKYKMSH